MQLSTRNSPTGEISLSTNLQKLALRAQAIRNRDTGANPYRSKAQATARWFRRLATVSVLFVMFVMLTATVFRASAQTAARPNSGGSAPLVFEPSSIAGSPIRYIARASGYTVFLSDEEADVVLQEAKAPSKELQRGDLIVVEAHASLLRMRFVDANPPTSLNAVDREGLPHAFTAIAYRGVYPGTDIILRGDQHCMQFRVKLGPGASAENIVIEFAGATGLDLQVDGTAVVHAGSAALLLQKPVILFGNIQTRQSASGGFRIENGNRLRLVLGASAPVSTQIIGD